MEYKFEDINIGDEVTFRSKNPNQSDYDECWTVHGKNGNDLLKLQKTAFLCSRKIPASIVLKCYDWAIDQQAN